TIEWTVNEFKTAGLTDAKVEPYAVPGPMWVPQSWQLHIVGDAAFGAGTQPVTLQSAFPQPGGATIPGGSLTAPVIFVGHGTDADLAGRDVKGKIAVVRVRPEPSLFGAGEQGVAARLVEKGAAGVINAVEGPGNAQYIDPRFACGKSPCFMVGGNDAWFLQQVIGKAANAGVLDTLKISMSLASGEQTGLTSANGIAMIPGQSAKRIIINAHADGYFQGGDDNASGLAVLVGLAKYFAKQPRPKHTLMFVASGGHHGPGNGPASLVAAHPELKDNTLMVVNLEHVAYADIVRGKTRATNNTGMTWEVSVTEAAKAVGVTNESPFLFDLWRQASRCYGVATYQSARPAAARPRLRRRHDGQGAGRDRRAARAPHPRGAAPPLRRELPPAARARVSRAAAAGLLRELTASRQSAARMTHGGIRGGPDRVPTGTAFSLTSKR
ncbi:MAG TPA: M28 family peptidase, partial [Candidatus Elarobacter sp.]